MSLKLRIYLFPRSLQKSAQELAEAYLKKVKNAASVWGGVGSKQGHKARQERDQFPHWQKDKYLEKRNSNIELMVATSIPGSEDRVVALLES